MNKNIHESDLIELFSRDMDISDETNAKLTRIYDEIRRNGKKMRSSESEKKHISINKRLITVAAAILSLTIFSVTVFATEMFHSEFLQSIFGNQGVKSTEEHAASNNSQTMLPGNERVSVNEALAEKLVGDYINQLNKEVSIAGYDFTIENCLIDENGMGYITYWLEYPDGLDLLKDAGYSGVCFSPDDGIGPNEPALTRNSEQDFSCHSFRDENLSTDTKAYLIMIINPFYDVSEDDKLAMLFSGFEKDTENIAEEDDEVYVSKEVPLSLKKRLPYYTYSDSFGKFTVEVSAVGIQIISNRESVLSSSAVRHKLTIRYKDGSKYIVKDVDKNSANYWCSSGYGNRENMVFNRLVNTDEIYDITIDSTTLTLKK